MAAAKKRATTQKATTAKPPAEKRAPHKINEKITPLMVTVWGHYLCGLNQSKIAELTGVHRNTVHRYIESIKEILDTDFDAERIRKGMRALMPSALVGLLIAFERGDSSAINKYMQEMQVYGAGQDGLLGKLDIDLKVMREQNQKEGFAKLGIRVNDNMG